MAKSPVLKFPRIAAGFYHITKDGELVGYIMKEVDDDKESNWYIFDNATPNLDIAMLHPENAIDSPDGLFREAKDSAKVYFMNKPVKVEDNQPMIQIAPMQEAQWVEVEEDEPVKEAQWVEGVDGDELIEDDNLFVSDDGELEIFEDEFSFVTSDVEELALV